MLCRRGKASMTPPWLLASSGASLVELKSEAQLRFVGAAIADARRKAFTLYLVVEPELRPLAAILLSGLGAAERPHTGELVKAFPLRGGRTARYIDLTTTQDSDDAVIAKVNELIVLKAFLIVEGAERLPLPNPDFSIELRPPLPGQTRQKYL